MSEAFATGTKEAFATGTKFAFTSVAPTISQPLYSTACKCEMPPAHTTGVGVLSINPCCSLQSCIVVPSTSYEGAGYSTTFSVGYTTSYLAGFLACEVPPLFGVKVFTTVANPVFSSIPRYHLVYATGFKLGSCAVTPVVVVPCNAQSLYSKSAPSATNALSIVSYIHGASGLKTALACKNALISFVTGLKLAAAHEGVISLSTEGLPSLMSSAIRALSSYVKNSQANSAVRAPACEGVCMSLSFINVASVHEGVTSSCCRGLSTICSSSLLITSSVIKSAIGGVKRHSNASSANGTTILPTGINVHVMRAFTSGSLMPPNWSSGSLGVPGAFTGKFPEIEEKIIVTTKLKLSPDLRARLFNLLEPVSANALLDLSDGAISVHWHNNLADLKGDDLGRIIKELQNLIKDLNVDVYKEVRWWE